MLRKAIEAVSEGNGPVHQEEEFGFGQPAPVDEFREIKSLLKQRSEKLDGLHDDLKDGTKRIFEQFSARLEHFLEQDARQRGYAMEANETANTKPRERAEGAAIAVQTMRGDRCTTKTKGSIWTENLDQFRHDGRTSRSPFQGRRFGRRRSYGARVVSPILGDVLINSHWWLNSHRRSLHSHGDRLQRATFSVLRDRGDESKGEKFMDFDSIRLVRQQRLP